ncbi:GDSL esterase/lipase [Acorus calamus]|uniref:GDSL esterase/lipase n=1 Tax=Acorus calamus TaxID=4465 RepID=A0AAV9EZJ7_ACOCL|nr:GDSL esterase/lipase [Acorus calamus]
MWKSEPSFMMGLAYLLHLLRVYMTKELGFSGSITQLQLAASLSCSFLPPASNQMDSVGCSIPINQMAEYFNSELNRTVVQLRKELPLAVLTYVDVYSVKYKLISHADEYGFTYPLKACCGYGGGKYNFNGNIRCDSPVVVNGTLITVKSCKDPLTHVNFDGFHFTDAANQWFFDRINTGAYSDPPLSLADACLKHA